MLQKMLFDVSDEGDSALCALLYSKDSVYTDPTQFVGFVRECVGYRQKQMANLQAYISREASRSRNG